MDNLTSLNCYIRDQRVLRKFISYVGKNFTLSPPSYFIEGVIYTGPLAEVQRLKLFYEGMIFYEQTRGW